MLTLTQAKQDLVVGRISKGEMLSAGRFSSSCHDHPQHPDLATVLGFMLHQVVQYPFGGHGVVGEVAFASELIQGHATERGEHPLTHSIEPQQVRVQADSLGEGEMPSII